MRNGILAWFLVLALVGCGTTDSAAPAEVVPDPSATAPTPPGKADSPEALGYTLSDTPAWSLIGNALTPGHDRFEITVTAPDTVGFIDLWLDDRPGQRLEQSGDDFLGAIDLSDVSVGEHTVLLASDGSDQAFASLTFVRSHPLYVFVSNDWDEADNDDDQLERQERLHREHPELKLTHFVGPYTFTDPAQSPQRAEFLASWVKGLRDTEGDEIGLHIHPYCNFVNTTSVTCRTAPSFAEPDTDTSGYTVILASYTKEEMAELLKAADRIFEEQGFGKPTSFRAGGWTAETHILEALAEDGFVADGSGANWSRLEEWRGLYGTSLYAWCQEHWTTINDTSQPYYPSQADMRDSTEPVIPILEVPDNGLLVDYVSAQEMIDIMRANWEGGGLERPTVVSIGYHPPNFSEMFYERMDGALDEIDRYLVSADEGPVVYATLSELASVFPEPR